MRRSRRFQAVPGMTRMTHTHRFPSEQNPYGFDTDNGLWIPTKRVNVLRTLENYTLTLRRLITDHGLGVRLDGDRVPDQRARQQQQRHDAAVSAIRRHHVGDAKSPRVSCSGRRRPVPGSRLRGRQRDFPDTRYRTEGLATLVSSAALEVLDGKRITDLVAVVVCWFPAKQQRW